MRNQTALLAVRYLALAAWVLVLGCDARATATDPQAAAPRAEQKSREYESCGATVHCAEELRCYDQLCLRTQRSVVGDYHAALGAALRGRGKVAEAVVAYAEAQARYLADKGPLPPDLDCAYGGALAASSGKKEQSELAARVLHRCLMALPVGGDAYRRALADLALLAEAGLDPEVLGKPAAADVYLTKGPARKPSDAVTVTATANPMPGGKTFPLLVESISSVALRPALIACWEAHLAATSKEELVVTLGVKTKYTEEYDDEPGVSQVTFDAPAAGGDSAADTCVRAALEPIKKTPGLRDNAATKLTITMK